MHLRSQPRSAFRGDLDSVTMKPSPNPSIPAPANRRPFLFGAGSALYGLIGRDFPAEPCARYVEFEDGNAQSPDGRFVHFAYRNR
jgi:hypothetical protein